MSKVTISLVITLKIKRRKWELKVYWDKWKGCDVQPVFHGEGEGYITNRANYCTLPSATLLVNRVPIRISTAVLKDSCVNEHEICLYACCRWVIPDYCDCPNGQLPSWHRRRRREVEEKCSKLVEKHNKYLEEYVY